MEKSQALPADNRPMSMHPTKFALWLFMITVVMLFAAFTSAYLVRRDAGAWLQFSLPSIFLYNTFLLVVSSVTMHLGYLSAKKDDLAKVKLYVLLTLFLGLLFMALQLTLGGYSLAAMDIPFGGVDSKGSPANPAGSFVYVFFFVHVLHIIAGVGFLINLYIQVVKSKVNSQNMIQMEMASTFWHFLDLLWVYLYVFLLIIN